MMRTTSTDLPNTRLSDQKEGSYPSHLARSFQLPDGEKVSVRPIRPEDADIEQEFVRRLSPESRHFRFMGGLKRLSPVMLKQLTDIDYDNQMALIAVVDLGGQEQEIGVARYAVKEDGESCEFAVVVADEWQGNGIATKLMNQLVESARSKKLKRVEGTVMQDNYKMLDFARTHGFAVEASKEDPEMMRVWKAL